MLVPGQPLKFVAAGWQAGCRAAEMCDALGPPSPLKHRHPMRPEHQQTTEINKHERHCAEAPVRAAVDSLHVVTGYSPQHQFRRLRPAAGWTLDQRLLTRLSLGGLRTAGSLSRYAALRL